MVEGETRARSAWWWYSDREKSMSSPWLNTTGDDGPKRDCADVKGKTYSRDAD